MLGYLLPTIPRMNVRKTKDFLVFPGPSSKLAPFAPINHEEAEIEMELSHANQFLEFCLIEDRHTEFSRLVVLRPRIRPDHNIIRFFAHRTDHLAAMLQHDFAGFFARTIH